MELQDFVDDFADGLAAVEGDRRAVGHRVARGRMSTHLALPDYVPIGSAKLPATYEAAKVAITNCARIDECQEWANKAEALASYAKQADDDTLRQMADRIQARAIRRAGELLKQFDGRGRPAENNTGAHTISRTEAGREAGLSKHKIDIAVRVANVPAETFEKAATDADRPPYRARDSSFDYGALSREEP